VVHPITSSGILSGLPPGRSTSAVVHQRQPQALQLHPRGLCKVCRQSALNWYSATTRGSSVSTTISSATTTSSKTVDGSLHADKFRFDYAYSPGTSTITLTIKSTGGWVSVTSIQHNKSIINDYFLDVDASWLVQPRAGIEQVNGSYGSKRCRQQTQQSTVQPTKRLQLSPSQCRCIAIAARYRLRQPACFPDKRHPLYTVHWTLKTG
jgi:hypothetical protein